MTEAVLTKTLICAGATYERGTRCQIVWRGMFKETQEAIIGLVMPDGRAEWVFARNDGVQKT